MISDVVIYKTNSILFAFRQECSTNIQFDDLFVRKYVEPEPSNGDWGAEETINFAVVDQAWVSMRELT